VTADSVDPRQIARSMFDRLDLPDLQIDMNPRLGMVAIPTWFWVVGYNGDVIPLTDNMQLRREECHDVVDRGVPAADGTMAPSTRRACTILYDSLTVQVRAWPKTFRWSFGDNGTQTVTCQDLSICTAGLGLPYSDARTPSPIAHAYLWSSLGMNGSADAYRIDLAIVFRAQYRFSINGSSGAGWQDLGDRELGWSAGHRVQEAQAVLTRP
jgi:hypothetical protein